MRTLSPQEIAQIDQRLESLKINYLEIYHELRDHYFTTLEKKPAVRFDATFQELNGAFAWSVVKRMEQELRKGTSKQIAQMQWNALRFWKLKWWEIFIAVTFLSTIPIIYFSYSLEDLITFGGIVGLLGAIGIWSNRAIRNSLNFSISKHKPISCFSAELFARIALALGMMPWFLIGSRWISKFDSNLFVNLTFIFLIVSVSVYLITLNKVVWTKKHQAE
jgi:hypothetical protein